MALRVQCKCGKTLKVSSSLADKTLQCPSCAKPFRISQAQFEQAARRHAEQTTSRDSIPSKAPPQPQVPSDAKRKRPIIELEGAAEPAALDDMLMAEAHSQSDLLDLKIEGDGDASPRAALPVTSEPEADLGYARDHAKRGGPGRKFDAVTEPHRGFWDDALVAFVYPVMNADNAINFLVLGTIVCINLVFTFLIPIPCLGLIVGGVIFGWQASVYLGVVAETGRGSDDIPTSTFDGGMYDGVVRPALNFVGAFALVLAPFFGLVILSFFGFLPQKILDLAPVWAAVGVFLFPISLMLFAFESPAALLRPQLIVSTIAATILPYLAIWGLLLVVATLWSVALAGDFIIARLPSVAGLTVLVRLAASFVGAVIATYLRVYLMLVAMRLVGLYYLHFKKRFTFQME